MMTLYARQMLFAALPMARYSAIFSLSSIAISSVLFTRLPIFEAARSLREHHSRMFPLLIGTVPKPQENEIESF